MYVAIRMDLKRQYDVNLRLAAKRVSAWRLYSAVRPFKPQLIHQAEISWQIIPEEILFTFQKVAAL